jgi:NTP pyrophosphatase (non-canonical NTP hydrolase)
MLAEIQIEQAHAGIDPALQVIREERQKQIDKWGTQHHDPRMWLAILGEEFGEVAKEIAEGRIKTFDRVAYVKELAQVAAVAVAAIQCCNDGVA